MMAWKERISVGLPRAMVVAHDLCMVWLAWIGLHQFRYAMLPTSPGVALWSTEIALVLMAQGLVFWRVGPVPRHLALRQRARPVQHPQGQCLRPARDPAQPVPLQPRQPVPRTVLVLYPIVLTALLGHAAPAVSIVEGLPA